MLPAPRKRLGPKGETHCAYLLFLGGGAVLSVAEEQAGHEANGHDLCCAVTCIQKSCLLQTLLTLKAKEKEEGKKAKK